MTGSSKIVFLLAVIFIFFFSGMPAFSQVAQSNTSGTAFQPLDPGRFVKAVETLIREFDPDFGLKKGRYSASDIEILKRRSRRLEDNHQYQPLVDARLAPMFDHYAKELPPAVQELPNEKSLPDYDNLDRKLVILTNLQATEPDQAQKLKYLKFFLFGPSAFHIEGYPHVAAVQDRLKHLAGLKKDLVRLVEYGRSRWNQPLLAVEITDRAIPAWQKPVIEFDAMIHPSEITSLPVVLDIIDTLTRPAENPEVSDWLKYFRFLIIPLFNPDGARLVHEGNVHQNNNAYNLNGILAGVNLNRNFPFAWNKKDPSELHTGNPFSRSYRGPAAGSEPEVRAFMELLLRESPIGCLQYHSEGENLVYPSAKNNANVAAGLFQSVGRTMVRDVVTDSGKAGGMRVGKAMELYNICPGGAAIDWTWQEIGALAYVYELIAPAGPERPDQAFVKDLVRRHAPGWQAFIRRLGGSGFRGFVKPDPQFDLTRIRYRIVKQGPPMGYKFEEKRFPIRNDRGLFYSIVEPGNYRIEFELDNEPLRSIPVQINEAMNDLGEIELPVRTAWGD